MPHVPYAIIGMQFLAFWALGGLGCWAARRWGLGRMVGGAIAGLLLGPWVLGQVAPDTYRALMIGGAAEHRLLQALNHQRQQDRETLDSTGVTKIALDEFDKDTNTKQLQLVDQQEAAKLSVIFASLTLLILPFGFLTALHGILCRFGLATDRDGLWHYLVCPVMSAMVGANVATWPMRDLGLVFGSCFMITLVIYYIRRRRVQTTPAKPGR